MSTQYPGYPALARSYWRVFLKATVGLSMVLAFTGALAGLIVLVFLPETLWFFILAAASFVLHGAALFIRDVHRNEYEPDQTSFSSPVILLAMIVLIGVLVSTLLLIASAGAYAVYVLLGWPAIVAAGVAAYYPVVDLVLMRNGRWTPAHIVFICTLVILSTLLNVHSSLMRGLPVLGRQKRPQS